jgi:hypothetical protein
MDLIIFKGIVRIEKRYRGIDWSIDLMRIFFPRMDRNLAWL